MPDRLTGLARRIARRVHTALGGHEPKGKRWQFRLLSAAWRHARRLFHRLCRRNAPMLLVLDGPARLTGFGSLTGWCLSRNNSIRRIEAWVNGSCLAVACPCIHRPDVHLRFPDYRTKGPCGFRLAPEPGVLGDGTYNLRLCAWDNQGHSTELHISLEVYRFLIHDPVTLPCHLQGSDREYQAWIAAHPPSLSNATVGPLISLVMPVFRPNLRHLSDAIGSIRRQSYSRWELQIVDDGSNSTELSELLHSLAEADTRIRLQSLNENGGISQATNKAIALTSGEFVAFMDQDDLLAPNALQEVARAGRRQSFDLLYTDEDRIDAHGCRIEPFFKPDWSPDLLGGMMYLAHLCVYRREFLDRIGWCDSAFDGAQDWELALRASTHTTRILHVPQILYHWRLGGNSAGNAFNRVCHERGRRAIADAHRRLGRTVGVDDGPSPCTFHVRYPLAEQPLISLLIPTRDNPELLRRCLLSIRHKTTYPHYEILVIDNGSRTPAARRQLRRCGADRVLRYDIPFNHSRLNNLAAQHARGELLLLLNDDTEVISPEWLQAMAEQAMRPEVGAVGAWLFFPDGRTQHNGIVLGTGPVAMPLHSGLTRDGLDRGTTRLIRNVSAVTGACLMIRMQLYLEMQGLDERHFPTSFNDVDFCLRLRREGYRIIFTPLARLVHHETATRRLQNEKVFIRRMWDRWGETLFQDPYWNPNLIQGPHPPPGFSFHWHAENVSQAKAAA